jgi:indole-3-glycerol phosphate synthase
VTTAPDLLLRLVAESESEVERRRQMRPVADLERRLAAVPPAVPLAPALRGDRLAVIAEMKARTPTMGLLAPIYEPARLAGVYERAGASAISVLCQETSFGGDPEHLVQARSESGLPLIRKDFIVTEHQLLEARALDADAILLIVMALTAARLGELLGLCRELGMEALVEVHDEAEMDLALEAGARVVGVNHRDLTTFAVDIGLTERLRPLAPPDIVYVAESGIHGAADARRMRDAGADAVLVGEALMRAGDPAAVIEELRVR